MKKTIRDVEVSGKRVLVRVDFNVPLENGQILDDARIRASLPTIRYLIEHGARTMLLTHLGKPDGFVVESLRVNPIAARLADLLRMSVAKVNNCIGPEVHSAVKGLEPGQVLFLENVRFHPGEMVNDAHFAARLASSADLYVDDAFGSAQRSHASIVGITRYLPSVAGLLMESELEGLRRARGMIKLPQVIVLGGIRLVDKARFIDDNLVDGKRILLGGVIANTFLRARGFEVGQSQVENEVQALCREFWASYDEQIGLPSDVVVASSLSERAQRKVVAVNRIPADSCIVDIGPETIHRYSRILAEAGTIIWNGSLGADEYATSSSGTDTLVRKIAGAEGVVKLAGGGHTMMILDRLGLTDKMDYISTGGAPFLDALEDVPLPAVKALQDKEEETPPEPPEASRKGDEQAATEKGSRKEQI